MYIFMLTEGIIRARVFSRSNYSMVYYLLVFSHSFNINVTLFTIHIQDNIV